MSRLLKVFISVLVLGTLVIICMHTKLNPGNTPVLVPTKKIHHFNRVEYVDNVPFAYLNGSKLKTGFNSSCAKYPQLRQIHFSNNYWQVLETFNSTNIHMLGAYLDTRAANPFNVSVRLTTMVNKQDVNVKTYCQIWFQNQDKPVIVDVKEYSLIWYKEWGLYKEYLPYLASCNVPISHQHLVPESVSVVGDPCEHATNNLRIIYNKPEAKKGFAVCVKGLDFPYVDVSIRMVEWIELLLLFGAEKIYLYELEIHPNIKSVMDYYEERGIIQLTPFNLPAYEPNVPAIRHEVLKTFHSMKALDELIPYNDCFYKHMYEYKYIALLDTDEVITPLTQQNWTAMMAEDEAKSGDSRDYDAYAFRNVYFLDQYEHKHEWLPDVPSYMHMLQHVQRTRNYTKSGHYVKCFHNTETVRSLHNHFPMTCLKEKSIYCSPKEVDKRRGHLQHYRTDCVQMVSNCDELKKDFVIDANLLRFKDRLVDNVERVVKDLDLV